MKQILTIHRIDNGYLVTYPNGEKVKATGFFGPQEVELSGWRHAATPSDVASLVRALLERMPAGVSVTDNDD